MLNYFNILVTQPKCTSLELLERFVIIVKLIEKGGIAMVFERNFGKIVRDKRERKGLTIKQVAELSGLSDRGLEMIELGDSDPKLSSVLNIANALDIDLGEVNICIPEVETV